MVVENKQGKKAGWQEERKEGMVVEGRWKERKEGREGRKEEKRGGRDT